jgi:hypothetical protein
MTKLYIAALFLFLSFCLPAQSPPNLSSDIVWDSDPNTTGNQTGNSTLTQIANAFNNARRQEESAFGIPNLTLGVLTFPSGYSTYNVNYKALFLLNAERTCRANVNYSGTIVMGKPLEGIENTIDTMCLNNLNWQITNNSWSHTGKNGWNIFSRINNSPILGGSCHEFITRGENLAIFGTTAAANVSILERSFYGWIYADLGSAWGHREMCFLQNLTLTGAPNGFNDNYGGAGSEGFMSYKQGGGPGTTYNPVGWPTTYRIDMTVLNYYDPGTGTCSLVPFPLDLISLHIEAEKAANTLYWKTENEYNLSNYIIYRSFDGIKFAEIGRINANNSIRNEYAFVDKNYLNGVNYYKLGIQDHDDKIDFTKVLFVKNYDSNLSISVYPNPFQDKIRISKTDNNFEEKYEVIVKTLDGKTVLIYSDINVNEDLLDLSSLAPNNTYIVQLLNTNTNWITKITKF